MANRSAILLFGGGRMGSALLRGWIAGGIDPGDIAVIEPSPNAALLELAGSGVRLNPPANTARASTIVLAVKPQVVGALAETIHALGDAETMVVSIMAGKTLADLARLCPQSSALVRVHPNLPAAIGCGATAAASVGLSEMQRAFAERLFAAVGAFQWIDEDLLDVVTGLSGSGPAYVFYLAECLTEAGARAGLPRPIAEQLARATIAGAGAMLRQVDRSADDLRRDVTSPAGTTEAGLGVLMADGTLDRLVTDTVAAAAARARDLAG